MAADERPCACGCDCCCECDGTISDKRDSSRHILRKFNYPRNLWRSSPPKIKWSFVDNINTQLKEKVA